MSETLLVGIFTFVVIPWATWLVIGIFKDRDRRRKLRLADEPEESSPVLDAIAQLRLELIQHEEWHKARMDLILARIIALSETKAKRPIPVSVLDDYEDAQRRNLNSLEELNNGPLNKRR
jgi:hypothetical protein